jgi:ABC-type nitrate/sulfonate/bicarbonate transport system substrate-binding protein
MKLRCSVRVALLAMSVIAAWAAVTAPLRAQAPVELQVNAFAGAANLPIWVAQREGLFARQGLAVTLVNPQGSLDQFKGLMEGRYPIVVTAFDNVIAYRSSQGPAEVGAIPDLVAVMGIDGGLLTLVGSPGIGKIADLKGRTVAVDALSTGFTFALRDILLKSGLNQSAVFFIAVGNSEGRWKAMQDGRAMAALLTLPADLQATDHGNMALTTVAASFGHYLGNVVAVRQGWAASHRAELRAFLRGVSDGVTWLRAREHRTRAIEILHAQMPALDAGNIERVYAALLDPRQGLIANGALDPQGAATVLALRAKYADSTQGLQDVSAYGDARYLAAGPAPASASASAPK